MSPGARMLLLGTLMTVSPFPLVAGVQRRTPIAGSGTTIVTGDFPKAKVVVRIRTATLEQGCARACPTSDVWTKSLWWLKGGLKKAVVVQDVAISVNGDRLFVPASAFATLFEPGDASIRLGKRDFVLRIDAGLGASESYFTLLYFDAKNVNRQEIYSEMYPSHPTEVTRYYAITLGP